MSAQFTDRQRAAMTERVEEAKAFDVDMAPFEDWDSSWHGRFDAERRPGRGRDFNGVWCDGEKIVQISLDPYGHGYFSVGNVDWVHGGEDCECDVCEGIRDAEEAEWAARQADSA